MTIKPRATKEFDDLSEARKRQMTHFKTGAPKATPKTKYYCKVCNKELLRWAKYCIDHRLMKK